MSHSISDYAECHYSECRYTECGYAECRSALFSRLIYVKYLYSKGDCLKERTGRHSQNRLDQVKVTDIYKQTSFFRYGLNCEGKSFMRQDIIQKLIFVSDYFMTKMLFLIF